MVVNTAWDGCACVGKMLLWHLARVFSNLRIWQNILLLPCLVPPTWPFFGHPSSVPPSLEENRQVGGKEPSTQTNKSRQQYICIVRIPVIRTAYKNLDLGGWGLWLASLEISLRAVLVDSSLAPLRPMGLVRGKGLVSRKKMITPESISPALGSLGAWYATGKRGVYAVHSGQEEINSPTTSPLVSCRAVFEVNSSESLQAGSRKGRGRINNTGVHS